MNRLDRMTTRRELLIALGAGALTVPSCLMAQPRAAKVTRIGILNSESASDRVYNTLVDALRQGLRESGYEEGKNLAIEFRWAEGKYDRLPTLAAELVRLRVEVIVTLGIKAATAARGATSTIPIILPGTTADLVTLGLAASLARPGANVTGSSTFGPEIMAKRLEFLKEAIPHVTRVAVLYNPANSSFGLALQAMEVTARSRNLALRALAVRSPGDFPGVFAELAKSQVEAITVQDDTMFAVNRKTLTDLAVRKRLSSIGNRAFGEEGGLFGYGANVTEMYRRAAVYVDKIVKGARAGDLPIEQPTKFELVVNLKTAKALGIKIPDVIMLRADKVIE